MKKGGKLIFFLVNLIFGIYLVNTGFVFFQIPEIVSRFDNLIISIAGILIIVGGINYLRIQSKKLDF